MSNIDLESLPYPMFETTGEEKEVLREALLLISEYRYSYFLCLIVEHRTSLDCRAELRTKIENSLKEGSEYEAPTLDEFFGLVDVTPTMMADLRRIWIRKLLEYTGEAV